MAARPAPTRWPTAVHGQIPGAGNHLAVRHYENKKKIHGQYSGIVEGKDGESYSLDPTINLVVLTIFC